MVKSKTKIDEQYKRKTSPELAETILAAKKLKVKPEECIVIEDALQGFAAAKAANMSCVALLTSLKAYQIPKGNYIAKSHKELVAVIKSIK